MYLPSIAPLISDQAMRSSALVESLVGIVSVRVPAVSVCDENVYAAIARFDCVLLYSKTQSVGPTVTVVKTIDAEGVQYAVVPEVVGGVAFVTVTPPAVYPAPDTSLVAEYAVVDAFTVAVLRYNAALIVSVVGEVKLVRDTMVTVPN